MCLANQVVGIPTLAATDQQIGGAAPGIGFAIPSNIVTDIAGQIIKTGHVTDSHRAALGVEVQTVMGPSGQPAGVSIAAITPGGPAAKAGLQPGDVITAVNQMATPDTETLAAVLADLHPGQQVSVSITKADGSTTTMHLAVGSCPAPDIDHGPGTASSATRFAIACSARSPITARQGMAPIPTPRPIGRGRPRATAPSPLICAAGCPRRSWPRSR
jgi:membrane-associated protease RseP (regulator of RpoE activity)